MRKTNAAAQFIGNTRPAVARNRAKCQQCYAEDRSSPYFAGRGSVPVWRKNLDTILLRALCVFYETIACRQTMSRKYSNDAREPLQNDGRSDRYTIQRQCSGYLEFCGPDSEQCYPSSSAHHDNFDSTRPVLGDAG